MKGWDLTLDFKTFSLWLSGRRWRAEQQLLIEMELALLFCSFRDRL